MDFPKEKIVLGIDPGFSVTGFSLAAKQQGRVVLLDCGYLKLNPKNSLSQRTGQFYTVFQEKIKKFNVTDIALETSFLGKNAQTFLKLGYLRGILYLLADQHQLALSEFAPREIKMAVTGWGGASKEQVAGMMFRLFPKLSEFGSVDKNDVTDALAISLCGIWHETTLLQKMQG